MELGQISHVPSIPVCSTFQGPAEPSFPGRWGSRGEKARVPPQREPHGDRWSCRPASPPPCLLLLQTPHCGSFLSRALSCVSPLPPQRPCANLQMKSSLIPVTHCLCFHNAGKNEVALVENLGRCASMLLILKPWLSCASLHVVLAWLCGSSKGRPWQ